MLQRGALAAGSGGGSARKHPTGRSIRQRALITPFFVKSGFVRSEQPTYLSSRDRRVRREGVHDVYLEHRRVRSQEHRTNSPRLTDPHGDVGRPRLRGRVGTSAHARAAKNWRARRRLARHNQTYLPNQIRQLTPLRSRDQLRFPFQWLSRKRGDRFMPSYVSSRAVGAVTGRRVLL